MTEHIVAPLVAVPISDDAADLLARHALTVGYHGIGDARSPCGDLRSRRSTARPSRWVRFVAQLGSCRLRHRTLALSVDLGSPNVTAGDSRAPLPSARRSLIHRATRGESSPSRRRQGTNERRPARARGRRPIGGRASCDRRSQESRGSTHSGMDDAGERSDRRSSHR